MCAVRLASSFAWRSFWRNDCGEQTAKPRHYCIRSRCIMGVCFSRAWASIAGAGVMFRAGGRGEPDGEGGLSHWCAGKGGGGSGDAA